MTEETDAALMRAGAQIEALRQQLQAARDRAEEVQAQMEDVVREVLCRAFPDGTELIPAFYAWYVPSQWLWWGRALGAFIGTEAAKRQAEAWEEAAKVLEEAIEEIPITIPDRRYWQGVVAALRLRKGEG